MDKVKQALDMLESVSLAQVNSLPPSAQRLAALALVVADVPWDGVQSIKVSWDMIDEELVPNMDLVMKGELP